MATWHPFRSIKSKVGISFVLLNILSISVFSAVILLHQLELVSENTRFKAQALVGSVVTSMHKMPLPVSTGALSWEDRQIVMASLSKMLSQQIPNYALIEGDKVLAAFPTELTLPADFTQQSKEAYALLQNSATVFHSTLNAERTHLDAYVPLEPIGLRGVTMYTRVSLHEIGDAYKVLYVKIGFIVLSITVLHILFGLFFFRIVMVPLMDLKSLAERVSMGDYSAKVAVRRDDEIGVLSVSFNRMAASLHDGSLRMQKQADELKEVNAKIERMVITDELTGLINRRHFFEYMQKHIAQALRYTSPLSLILIDFDHFKQLNDNYGHIFGDKVLRESGQKLSHLLRDYDILARYGGEQMIILLPETDLPHAGMVAGKIAQMFSQAMFELPTRELLQITVSMGVAELHAALMGDAIPRSSDLMVSFVGFADKALMQAKANGRNQTVLYSQEAL